MAITKGAKKAHRNSLRKRVFNTRRKAKVAQSTKSLKKLVTAGDKKGVEEMMKKVQSSLDKAVKGKYIKKNTAARRKSRLSKLAKKL